MTTLREAAQQALEALDGVLDSYGEPLDLLSISGGAYEALQCREAITALRAALAEPVQECPHGVTDGNCKECYGKATNSEPFTVYSVPLRCPNCASLEAQNTELDQKLADLEQTSLELCKACGWRTLIPAEGCLNCARSKPLTIERLRDALVTSHIIQPAAVEDPDEYDDGVTLFRIEALHRRIT